MSITATSKRTLQIDAFMAAFDYIQQRPFDDSLYISKVGYEVV